MTPRERLFARLRGQAVDRPPNLSIVMQFASRYIGQPYDRYCQDHRVLVEGNLRCAADFGIDVLTTMSDPYTETHDYGAAVEFPPDSLPVCTDILLQQPSDLAKLKRFDPVQAKRMGERIRAIALYKARAGDRYPIIGWVEGPLAQLADLRGLMSTLMDLPEDPTFVEEAFAVLVDQAIRCAVAQIGAGADIIGVGDAAASLVGPDLYRQHVLAAEQRLIAAIHNAGALAKLHICGDVNHLLDDLWRTGADIIDLDWMVDLGAALAKWPAGPVANGIFDPVTIMLQGTPAQVRQAAIQNMADGANRVCISPGCEVPPDTPVQNLRALDEALRSSPAR